MSEPSEPEVPDEPKGSGKVGKAARGFLQTAGGAIPLAGGLLSAAAGLWSEAEQDKINAFLRACIKMLEDEMREKERVIGEVIARLDVHDEKIGDRIRSEEFQSLVKKALRNWAGTESLKKQQYIRNILSNAGASTVTSDDVIRLFLEWLHSYSELHFLVIGDIYKNPGATRGEIWQRLGKAQVREDSAEADLFKLLIRDLSTGGVIRQHRETDYAGNFISKPRPKGVSSMTGARALKSAFDESEHYELTALGQMFVHYAMNELTPKIEYREHDQPLNESNTETLT